eukprot:CAMPEP_0201724836 /NCGR_PEP_ID=MMETSP0593-20130828/8435_1 /ASSEMBLY_ACC=CAM_ASM_000672 /TAXON_ID=267983 /ORGANISM="Skeletonema japonicum, Strain CCMP2506" /LENGTH=368 /DNA_ID=CAMNT_0048216139 /DNA_START=97 /DNA_END=1203 /DNA_ORIENTATION=-
MGGLRPSRKNTQSRLEEAADAKNVESTSSETPPSSSAVESSTKPLQREAWTARGTLLLKFHDAISLAINSPEMRRKCSEVASSMSSAAEEEPEETSSTLVNHEYDAEATLIVQNKHKRDNDVRDKALAVGFCTFLFLRGVPIVRNVVARRMAAASRYKFESASPHQQLSGSTTLQQSVQQPARESPSRLRKFLRLTLDITISAAMTVLSGTFIFTPRPSAYIEDMSKLPLVKGKSVYAEVVCPPLLNEYKRTLEQYGGRWPVMSSPSSSGATAVATSAAANAPTLTQEDVSLNIIRKFAENCSKRIKYERAILEEQNALDELEKKKKRLGTVLIPRPVPEDVKVNIDEDVFFLIDDADTAKDGKACIE